MAGGDPPNSNDTDTKDTAEDTSAISVRIGPIWRNKIKLWFVQVEAQFFNAKITKEIRRYNHVVANLESDVAELIADFFDKALSDTPYTDLKNRIIAEFSESETRKVQKLLSELELGDKKPTALLREMRSLAGSNIKDEFLQSMFIQRLPTHVRSILVASSDNLDTLATMADKIMENSPSTHVYGVAKANDATSQTERLDRLEKMVFELTTAIKGMTSRSRPYNRSQTPPARPRSQSGSRKFCWYHHTFRSRATNCTKPCAWDPNYKSNKQHTQNTQEN